MSVEIMTWRPNFFSPIVISGASGNDIYNIPGGTKLDNSIDTNGPTRIDVGLSNIYSTPPTFAEVCNVGSGINQIIAYINFRGGWVNSIRTFMGFVTNFTPLTYLTQNTRIRASHITTIQAAITDLQSKEGFTPSNTFTVLNSGDKILGKHIAELRYALRLYGVLNCIYSDNVFTSGIPHFLQRKDTPYNTLISEGIASANGLSGFFGSNLIGKLKEFVVAGNPEIWRSRRLSSFAIPSFMSQLFPALSFTASYNIQIDSKVGGSFFAGSSMETPVFELWSSDTNDFIPSFGSTYSSYAYNLNHLEGSYSGSPATISISVPASRVYVRNNSFMSFIVGTSSELSNGGNGGSAAIGQEGSYFHIQTPTFTIDFGT